VKLNITTLVQIW